MEKLRRRHKAVSEKLKNRRENDQLDVPESRRTNRDRSSPFDRIKVYRLIEKRHKDRSADDDDDGPQPFPGVDRHHVVCSGYNCATITSTLGFPVRDFNRVRNVLVVGRHGLLTVPVGRKRFMTRQYPCKRIRQKTETYMRDLENWQICHLRGHIPPDVMAMIRNNYFIVVTRTHGNGRRMILVQKDDHRITNEIIRRILHGFEGGRSHDEGPTSGKPGGNNDDGEDLTLIETAFEDKGENFQNDKMGEGSGGAGGGAESTFEKSIQLAKSDVGGKSEGLLADATFEKFQAGKGGGDESNALVCTSTDRPCLNDGVCQMTSDNKTSTCFCSFGYVGDLCKLKIVLCSADLPEQRDVC